MTTDCAAGGSDHTTSQHGRLTAETELLQQQKQQHMSNTQGNSRPTQPTTFRHRRQRRVQLLLATKVRATTFCQRKKEDARVLPMDNGFRGERRKYTSSLISALISALIHWRHSQPGVLPIRRCTGAIASHPETQSIYAMERYNRVVWVGRYGNPPPPQSHPPPNSPGGKCLRALCEHLKKSDKAGAEVSGRSPGEREGEMPAVEMPETRSSERRPPWLRFRTGAAGLGGGEENVVLANIQGIPADST